MKWNGLAADNVAHAAGAITAACVRWAWRITAGLCHAFA